MWAYLSYNVGLLLFCNKRDWFIDWNITSLVLYIHWTFVRGLKIVNSANYMEKVVAMYT